MGLNTTPGKATSDWLAVAEGDTKSRADEGEDRLFTCGVRTESHAISEKGRV